jgi:hypothetical protein
VNYTQGVQIHYPKSNIYNAANSTILSNYHNSSTFSLMFILFLDNSRVYELTLVQTLTSYQKNPSRIAT